MVRIISKNNWTKVWVEDLKIVSFVAHICNKKVGARDDVMDYARKKRQKNNIKIF